MPQPRGGCARAELEGAWQMPPRAPSGAKKFPGPFLVPLQAARGVYVNVTGLSQLHLSAQPLWRPCHGGGRGRGKKKKAIKKEQAKNIHKHP